jgi:hypothetical protein
MGIYACVIYVSMIKYTRLLSLAKLRIEIKKKIEC